MRRCSTIEVSVVSENVGSLSVGKDSTFVTVFPAELNVAFPVARVVPSERVPADEDSGFFCVSVTLRAVRAIARTCSRRTCSRVSGDASDEWTSVPESLAGIGKVAAPTTSEIDKT